MSAIGSPPRERYERVQMPTIQKRAPAAMLCQKGEILRIREKNCFFSFVVVSLPSAAGRGVSVEIGR